MASFIVFLPVGDVGTRGCGLCRLPSAQASFALCLEGHLSSAVRATDGVLPGTPGVICPVRSRNRVPITDVSHRRVGDGAWASLGARVKRSQGGPGARLGPGNALHGAWYWEGGCERSEWEGLLGSCLVSGYALGFLVRKHRRLSRVVRVK